ncbi:hypothetical protein TIFTF001_016187 [Ficus carica]|uniref:Uncharacterized protein n=1 Tax=Ficus carica TaxID=3494 RepID=A0AA88A789_FICCA|nr:hypothetical protein TIFTF001_016187 [Ficus carica]
MGEHLYKIDVTDACLQINLQARPRMQTLLNNYDHQPADPDIYHSGCDCGHGRGRGAVPTEPLLIESAVELASEVAALDGNVEDDLLLSPFLFSCPCFSLNSI